MNTVILTTTARRAWGRFVPIDLLSLFSPSFQSRSRLSTGDAHVPAPGVVYSTDRRTAADSVGFTHSSTVYNNLNINCASQRPRHG